MLVVLLFAIEAGIAMFLHDAIVRPYVGDVLVVALIYCVVRSLTDMRILVATSGTLAFSFIIEFLQSQNLVVRLGLEKSAIARAVLGTSFSWKDMAMYVLGAVLVIAVEFAVRKGRLC